MQIEIKITQKRAEVQGSPVLVCGNSGDTVKFTFDNEWGQYSNKTARFAFTRDGNRHYTDVLFDGSVCEIPILSGIDFVEVGVYAGNLSTTTPAKVPTKKSILCKDGKAHEPPPEDVYDQIMEAVSTKLSTTGGTVTGDYYKDGQAFIHEGNLDLLDDTDNLAIVQTATGSALTIDSSEAPLQNLKLFGSTIQNGTPTPEAPVDLVSVGDSGSFEVGVYGANLWKTPPSNTATGVVGVANADGSYTLNGTAGNSYFVAVSTEFILPKGTYRHACDKPTGTESVMCFVRKKGDSNVISGNFTLAETTVMTAFIQVPPNATVNGTIYPKITIGTTVKPFEPYTKQTLTMPYTLRGVGDVKDEVDFNRGVFIQKCVSVTGFSQIGTNANTKTLWKKIDYNMVNDNNKALCSHTNNYAFSSHDNVHFYVSSTGATVHVPLDVDANSVEVIATLETPIETPLTETEINAYRQLHTNKPTTTILSEAEAEVDYYVNKPNAQAVGNVHAQINKDYLKLQQAIITLGGSTL